MCKGGGLGLQTAGGIAEALGVGAEAAATRSAYQYNAVVGEFNAKLAELRKEDAIERGRLAVQDVAREAKESKGKQVAAIAGSGIQLGVGSALDILAGTDIIAEVDISTVEANTRKEVFAEEVSALNLRTGAAFERVSAAGISPGLAATTSLINTGGQVARQWYKQQKTITG